MSSQREYVQKLSSQSEYVWRTFFVNCHWSLVTGIQFIEAPQLETIFTSTIGEKVLGWTGSFLFRSQNQTVFSYIYCVKTICITLPPQPTGDQVTDNNRGIESPDLEKVEDRCPEKVLFFLFFGNLFVFFYCPEKVIDHFSPFIDQLPLSYLKVWSWYFRWIDQSNHGKFSGWGKHTYYHWLSETSILMIW